MSAGCYHHKAVFPLVYAPLVYTTIMLVGWACQAPGVCRSDEPAERGKPTAQPVDQTDAAQRDVTQGALRIVDEQGGVVECPLKHTAVRADISGFLARATVTQTFYNPTDEKIEAVYVFPLPHQAAVDRMTMVIGQRRIVGLIKRRDVARQIYEQAIAGGQTAALLEQERPNIFTQSVGNIAPGQEVRIEISYVDVLNYDMGVYEFHFPMVVGPRYHPGAPTTLPAPRPRELSGKVSPPVPDTTRVPDASRISPPVLKPGFRTGHDIEIAVSLEAGVPIQDVQATNHQVDIQRKGPSKAAIHLKPADRLPNKDFVLRYGVIGQKPEMATLAHTGDYSPDARHLGNGYFMLMIQPREDGQLAKQPPREIVFLVDVSGSMRGKPTDKVRDAMKHMLQLCRPQDTVQVVTFANRTTQLFDQPKPVNEANIAAALNFTERLRGSGGTEMLAGVQRAIDQPLDNERVRIVVMLTDGYIGNEAEIMRHVGTHCGDQIRFWAIGIGSSPNMFLIDGVARQGGGMGKRLGLQDDTAALTEELMTRIQRAQLAKISIDWNGLPIVETFPARIPELWAGRPVILLGRYKGRAAGQITVRGTVEGEAVQWPLQIQLPDAQPNHDVLATAWARRKIEDLMQQTFYADSPAVEEMVTAIALDYRLMSQYTSFVAVDQQQAEQLQEPARPPRRMLVPVPLPEGTSWEGFYGEQAKDLDAAGLAFGLGQPAASRGLQLRTSSNRPAVRMQLARPAAAARPGAAARPAAASQPAAAGPARPAAQQTGSWWATSGRASRAATASRSNLGFAYGTRRGLGVSGNEALFEQELKEADRLDRSLAISAVALAQAVDRYAKEAPQALQSAQKLQQAGQLDQARVACLKAYYLDYTLTRLGRSAGGTSQQALSMLRQIRDAQLAQWRKEMPALEQRLDLVIRDQPLASALQQIAQQAAIAISTLPGSEGDAASLLAVEELSVEYLDLRRATLAESLDWLLQPLRLNWRLSDGLIVVASQRRWEVPSAWVYDVSLLIEPAADQAEAKEPQALQRSVQQVCHALLRSVREVLQGQGTMADWFAPAQILVIGSAESHAAVAQRLANLADPQASLEGDAAKLQAITSVGVPQRRQAAAARRARRHQARMLGKHQHFGWQLLAAAARGEVDLEALTQLQIAWSDPATVQLLKGSDARSILRSQWIVSEAARALPQQQELGELADQAQSQCRRAVTAALLELQQKPQDENAFWRVLFAQLAQSENASFTRQALPLLVPDSKTPAWPALVADASQSDLAAARIVAAALLGKPSLETSRALAALAEQGVRGEDLVVLLTLACRRADGGAWDAMRRHAPDLVGRQPLPGSVVVLVNSLSGAQLPTVAAK